jgi:hypothetical protein
MSGGELAILALLLLGLVLGSWLAWGLLVLGHVVVTVMLPFVVAGGLDGVAVFAAACLGLALLLSDSVRRYTRPPYLRGIAPTS